MFETKEDGNHRVPLRVFILLAVSQQGWASLQDMSWKITLEENDELGKTFNPWHLIWKERAGASSHILSWGRSISHVYIHSKLLNSNPRMQRDWWSDFVFLRTFLNFYFYFPRSRTPLAIATVLWWGFLIFKSCYFREMEAARTYFCKISTWALASMTGFLDYLKSSPDIMRSSDIFGCCFIFERQKDKVTMTIRFCSTW